MNLGERIYKFRTAKNMSQGDLADALDVSRQSVSKWETGTAVPELDKLIKLAELFEISLDELVGRGEQKAESPAPAKETTVKIPLGIRELIGVILIGAAVLVAAVTLLFHNFISGTTLLFALVLATAGICCIWPLNHFSNIYTFTVDALILLMCATSPRVFAFFGFPVLTIFIIQCLRYLKTKQECPPQEENT